MEEIYLLRYQIKFCYGFAIKKDVYIFHKLLWSFLFYDAFSPCRKSSKNFLSKIHIPT